MQQASLCLWAPLPAQTSPGPLCLHSHPLGLSACTAIPHRHPLALSAQSFRTAVLWASVLRTATTPVSALLSCSPTALPPCHAQSTGQSSVGSRQHAVWRTHCGQGSLCQALGWEMAVGMEVEAFTPKGLRGNKDHACPARRLRLGRKELGVREEEHLS